MSPTKRIFILFAVCVAWVPVAIYLGGVAAQNQDAAGKGIYSYITIMFLLVLGALVLGIPALFQLRQHKERVHLSARVAAWLILLSPVLVGGGAIGSELVGDWFR